MTEPTSREVFKPDRLLAFTSRKVNTPRNNSVNLLVVPQLRFLHHTTHPPA
jgi:hypothetical protein